MHTLRQYLTTLEDPRKLTRTLGDIDVCRDDQGKPLFTSGNSAVVFRIRHEGHLRSLRCYMRPVAHLAEIYGDRLLRRELFVYTSPDHGEWTDAVLGDWIEGSNLSEIIHTAASASDTARLATLAASFDRLAAELISSDRAHGDLKPENIIVSNDGSLHLIDFDAQFLPAFAGERSPELGTAAYQHPARTAADFDASLDDFPAALISTALHALTLDPTLLTRYPTDGLLFNPRRLNDDPALHETLSLFEQQGMAVQYRIARLLYSPVLRLFGLPELFEYAARRGNTFDSGTSYPNLFAENGLWGYRTDNKEVIPPVYDSGFDFTEGLAAVLLHDTWHYIDPTGRTQLSFPGCDAVKPFRNGQAQIVREGCKTEIDHTGYEFAI